MTAKLILLLIFVTVVGATQTPSPAPSPSSSPTPEIPASPPSADSSPKPGPYRVGGGVTAPRVIYRVDPEFSKEARKRKFAGNTLVSLIVGTDGLPTNIKVVRSASAGADKKNIAAGLSLDQKAIEAVSKYRFAPATRQGEPVAVEIHVDVNFQIF